MSENIYILHLSDLHFGNEKGFLGGADIRKILEEILGGAKGDRYIVISGDVTFQGRSQGYEECAKPIIDAANNLGIPQAKIIVCPGNHDIEKSTKSFAAFDAWSSRVRNDKIFTFTGQSVRCLEAENAVFVVVNTAFHLDHKYGYVDFDELNARIGEIDKSSSAKGKKRFAVAHHHCIPVLRDDTSTIRNAHGFLELLERHEFSLLMHGHQHAMLDMRIGGGGMKILGVGSVGFVTPGIINSFALITHIEGGEPLIRRFGLSSDTGRKIVELSHSWSIL